MNLVSLINNRAVRGLAYQLVLGAGLVLLAWFLYATANANLERQGIATGFGFLKESADFNIGETPIPYDSSDSYARALVVGVLNTLRVSVVGIVCATVLGVAVGISRLSPNWLLARLASAYVEICRNVPVVLHAIFWASVMRHLPNARAPLAPFEGVYLSNRGLSFPVPIHHPVHAWMGLALAGGVAAAICLAVWARRRGERTGHYPAILPLAAVLLLAPPLVPWIAAGLPMNFDVPALQGFNYRGGFTVSTEYAALLTGISVYTSAFIAELVRSGINAVPRGQAEAAMSLGLRRSTIMRRIILPQALRVIVPPTASQYLSLAKNSSLGVLVGYPDLVSVGNTTLNQSGRAVEAIAIMMIVYLGISLTISLAMNAYNRMIALEERGPT